MLLFLRQKRTKLIFLPQLDSSKRKKGHKFQAKRTEPSENIGKTKFEKSRDKVSEN
jgi:hypothetical protein